MTDYTEEYRLLRDSVDDLREGIVHEAGTLKTQKAVVERLDLILSRFPKKEPMKWEPPRITGVKKLTSSKDKINAWFADEDELREVCDSDETAEDMLKLVHEYQRQGWWRRQPQQFQQFIYDQQGFNDKPSVGMTFVFDPPSYPFNPMGIVLWGADSETTLRSVKIGTHEQMVNAIGRPDVPAIQYNTTIPIEKLRELARENRLEHPCGHGIMHFDVCKPGVHMSIEVLGRIERAAFFGIGLVD